MLAQNQWKGTIVRDRVPLGPGTVWQGSWQDVHGFRTKSLVVKSYGAGGSLAIVTGLTGTGAGGLTGTYYGPAHVGTYSSSSFTEMLGYIKPVFTRSGASRGTVSVGLGLGAL